MSVEAVPARPWLSMMQGECMLSTRAEGTAQAWRPVVGAHCVAPTALPTGQGAVAAQTHASVRRSGLRMPVYVCIHSWGSSLRPVYCMCALHVCRELASESLDLLRAALHAPQYDALMQLPVRARACVPVSVA